MRTALILGAAALVATASAGPQGYARRYQTIRAGVVTLDADRQGGYPTTAAPYAFYRLENSAPIKPASWTFDNPNAPTFADAQVAAKYGVAQGATKITKRNAPYWEVRLSQLNDQQLAAYDVLLVAPRFNAGLNPDERNRLRKFVDQGGVLWVDMGLFGSATELDPVNNFPVAFSLQTAGEGGAEASDFGQPLLSRPNPISPREMSLLNQEDWSASNWFVRDPVIPNRLVGSYPGFDVEFGQYQPVAFVAGGRTIVQARVGEGWIVVTSRGVAAKLSSPVGRPIFPDTGVAGFTAPDGQLGARGAAAAKLAVNAVSLAAGYRQNGASSRKVASNLISVDAPLLQRFQSDASLDDSTRRLSPVLYKGLAIATDGTRLVAFDARPEADLDQDGLPDDGFRDYGAGGTEDRVWQTGTLPGPLSAPVAVEVANPLNGSPVDQVLVVDANGTLHSFPAFPGDGQGRLVQTPTINELWNVAPPTGSAQFGDSGANPPTVHEGIALMSDSITAGGNQRGRLWAVNLRRGQALGGASPFSLGGPTSDVPLPGISSGPTVGYVPIQDNSGGVDRIAYVPTLPIEGAGANPNNTAGMASVWVGVKGERPVQTQISGTQLTITTRAAQQGGLSIYLPTIAQEQDFAPRVHLVNNATGDPVPTNQLGNYLAGSPISGAGGILNVAIRNNSNWPNVSVRVDYTLNWGDQTPGVMSGAVRGQINYPDNGPNRRVVGPLALSPEGTVFATVAGDGPGGSLIGLREEGRGVFRCTFRYDLYDEHNVLLNDAARQPYREVLADNDPAQLFLPSANDNDRRLANFAFRTAPSIRNGQVLVGVSATKNAIQVPGIGRIPNVPVGILMAFRSDPPVAEIPVGNLGAGVTLVQSDIARSQDKTQPEQQAILSDGNFTYDQTRGVIRIENLMGVNRGPMLASMSLSQPVIVRPANGPDRLIEPDAVGGRWSPLLWYTTVVGLNVPPNPAGVVTTGGTVYMAGESLAYNILANGELRSSGQIYAYDAEIGPNDPSIASWTLRPWVKQLCQIVPNGPIRGSEHVRWPQLDGVTSLETFTTRLGQSVLVGSTAYGVVGGDDTLLAWSDEGLTAFTQADVVVCDTNRVGVFDSSGNALYTSDATANVGEGGAGAAGTVTPLARPVKAYRLSGRELLVVDAASNRVVRVDPSGREVRALESFRLDPAFVPPGYGAGDPTTLSNPLDAATWSEYVPLSGSGVLTNQGAVEYWVHTLVADSGNRRLLEVVDRYQVDADRRVLGPVVINGESQLGVLVWHSPANVSGAGYDYNSISRVYVPGASPRYVYVAGIGSTTPSREGAGLDSNPSDDLVRQGGRGNGGVVIFDRDDPRFVRVINTVAMPDLSNTPFWDEANGQFRTPASTGDPLVTARYAARNRPLYDVRSVTARVVQADDGPPILAVMVADGAGVVEFLTDGSDAEGTVPPVRWLLPNEAYTAIRQAVGSNAVLGTNPRQLRATYAKRLDSGEVLLVNGYVGLTRSRTSPVSFSGEVLQLSNELNSLSARNLGFDLGSIRFELGPIQGTRGLIQPIFADRR